MKLVKLYCFILSLCFFVSCFPNDINKQIKNNQAPLITGIYPSNDTLPENLLRFYIQFSKPMKTINNLKNIKLLNAYGEEIKGAVFSNVYELWDSEQRQLTIILDPARVKTGLVAHESLGRAIKPNQQYQLVVEKAEDIYGNFLKEFVIKDFFVTKADIEMPNLENWDVTTPKTNNRSPLTIDFSQILDYQSINNSIQLINGERQIVSGTIEITNNETRWEFFPLKKWKKGTYSIMINSRLEDPAGNNMNGLFDHKIGSLKSPLEGKMVEIKITLE